MSSPLLEHTSLCCGISLDSLQVMFRLFGGGCTIWPEARVASTCAAVTRQALPPFSGWMSANLTHVNHYGSFQSVPQLLRSLWTEAARTTGLCPSALLRRTPRCDGAPPHPSRADIPAPHSIVGPSICLPVGETHGVDQAQQARVQRIGKAPGSAEW